MGFSTFYEAIKYKKGQNMATITISKDDLKKLISTTVKESLIEVLTTRKDLLEDALIEAIEDIGLAKAMEEGDTGEYVSEG